MKLELLSLRAVNCGPLRDVRIDFTNGHGHANPVTLLAGANGSGKTTALELIAALAELLNLETVFSHKMLDKPAVVHPKPTNILGRITAAQIVLQLDVTKLSFIFGRNSPAFEVHDNWFQLIDLGYGNFRTSAGGFEWENFQSKIFYQRGMKIGLGFESVQMQDASGLLPSVLFIPHSRNLTSVDGTHLQREDTTYEWVYRYRNSDHYEGSLNSYLVWLEYSEPETFHAVQNVIAALYPQRKRIEIERKRLKAVVLLSDGSRHDLDQLSSGEQNLLITFLELRRRLIPGSIVLIDEIENSLHPAFQHRMAQGLLRLQREVPFQLIATSHAEAFIDVFGTEATRVLPMPAAAPK